MSRQINRDYAHWYNFAVPELQVTSFLARVILGAQVVIQEEPGRYVIDILDYTISPRRPDFISELMKEFDGVNVNRAIKRERLKVCRKSNQ